MVCYDWTIFENLESEGAKKSSKNKKFHIFTVEISSWNMVLIIMYNFDPYNVLLYIATNIAVLLMTASVLQGHIYQISESAYDFFLFGRGVKQRN